MTWREWFERALSRYPTPWKYLFEAQEYMRPVVEAAKRWCPPPATVLEAGCGIGISAMVFAAENYTVTGVDMDPSVLGLASRLPWFTKSQMGISTKYLMVELVMMDALKPVGGISYDLAFSGGVIEHDDPDRCIAMLRALKSAAPVQIVVIPSPLGIALNPDAEMGEQAFTGKDLTMLCIDAGWTVVEGFGYGEPGITERSSALIGKGYDPHLSLCVIGRDVHAIETS
jgi:SAM-dependent methyltransferase